MSLAFKLLLEDGRACTCIYYDLNVTIAVQKNSNESLMWNINHHTCKDGSCKKNHKWNLRVCGEIEMEMHHHQYTFSLVQHSHEACMCQLKKVVSCHNLPKGDHHYINYHELFLCKRIACITSTRRPQHLWREGGKQGRQKGRGIFNVTVWWW